MSFYSSDSRDESPERLQMEFAFPWEGSRPPQIAGRRTFALADPYSEQWQSRDYQHNTEKFRSDVRDQYARGNYNDGTTGAERYGDRRAEVGHIFSSANGGVNTKDNMYFQERDFNNAIRNDFDEVNCAFVGRTRTAEALKQSRDPRLGGSLTDWDGWNAREICDEGNDRMAPVGVHFRHDGGIDRRCAAYRRGEVWDDRYGMPHGLGDKVKELRDLEARFEDYASDSD